MGFRLVGIVPKRTRANSGPSITWNVFLEMNHREPPQLPAGMRKGILCLSIALLQVIATVDATALPRTRPPGSGPEQLHASAIPYLASVGPRPLRFQTPAPAPVLQEMPVVTTTGPSPTEETAVVAASDAARPGTEAMPPTTGTTADSANSTPAESSIQVPQPILRDHITPTVRAEDFLPYFQIPGSAQNSSDVTLLVPAVPAAPAAPTIPPSSATYRQTP